MELSEIAGALAAPFPPALVEIKPGAVTQDQAKALALAYVDARAYQDRLDQTAGPDGWSVEYRPLPGGAGLICRLIVCGVIREDVGEAPQGDHNQHTSAAMQAFKRACAAFGLGRYLYSLPQLWVPCEPAGKSVRIADPAGAVLRIYQAAGIRPATHGRPPADRAGRQ